LRNPATRWERAVLMYQREFADRLLAAPGNGDYGRLTVHASRWIKARHLRDVAPGCFEPPPKVWSAVVVLEPHAAPPFEVVDEKLWRAAVDGPFQQRRKKLRNTMPRAVAGLGVPESAAAAALEAEGATDRRPEEIAPESFARMVASMHLAREP
jgi:16S rRNA (adenine1518-N6/adenine1519-N6)-dimethyltransferase